MKKRNLIILAVVLVLLLIGAFIAYNQLSARVDTDQLSGQTGAEEQSQEETPVAAPEFTVYDAEGNPVKLSDFAGTPVVLNFWASWCGPCRSEMPHFNAKAEELEGKVRFLMVNATDGGRETVDTARAFIEEQGYTFPVFYDTDRTASISYQAYSLPSTFFIDAEGHAVAKATGAISEELLQKGIDMIYMPES